MSFFSVDGQQLYFAEFGNPQGIPLLFMHGGPGSGSTPVQAGLLYPQGFRIIQLDQRGAGQSLPLGSLTDNTTEQLVLDMERLRDHLQIERWVVYGGSWGTVLALEYAKRFAPRVLGLLLRGVFLARKIDWDWFAGAEGIAKQSPIVYQSMLVQLACPYGSDPAPYLAQALEQPPEQAYQAALAWDAWEAAVMGLNAPTMLTQQRWARVRVYAHYASHQFFLPATGCLNNLKALETIPVLAVHGRQDRVCQYAAAELLGDHLKRYELIGVDAGHNLYEQNLQAGLKQIAQRLYQELI